MGNDKPTEIDALLKEPLLSYWDMLNRRRKEIKALKEKNRQKKVKHGRRGNNTGNF